MLSDRPAPAAAALDHGQLRDLRSRAASRLSGSAAAKGAAAGAADALSVLHALALSPDTASNALSLLHELQVHQVELDLQAQELRDSRAELESALRRQTELFDLLPVGCFTVDARLVVHELNLAGADLLGVARDEACGLPLDAFFAAESVPRLRSAIAGVDAGRLRVSCRLLLCPRPGPERAVLAGIGKDATARRYLLSLAEASDDLEARPAAT